MTKPLWLIAAPVLLLVLPACPSEECASFTPLSRIRPTHVHLRPSTP